MEIRISERGAVIGELKEELAEETKQNT